MNKRYFPRALVGILTVILLIVASCKDDNGSPNDPGGSSMIQLSLTGLQPLTNGLNYQAWAIEYYNGYYYGYRLAFFNINESGQMVDAQTDSLLSGPFPVSLAADDVYGVGISIELSDTPVSTSSFTRLLGGQMTDGQATLTTSHWMGIGKDLTNISGKYVLATPTDSVTDNDLSGIWFLDQSSGVSTKGLNLPDLSNGWEYEGWVRINNIWVSTGKFTSSGAADDSSAHSGTFSAPAFPGEDFLVNAPAGLSFPTQLSDALILVTIEPWANYDTDRSSPFFLELLNASVPSVAAGRTTYYMNSFSNQLPTGTATIQ